jgi:hypothetical protein
MGAFKYSQLAWKEQAAKRLTASGKFVAGAFFDKDGAIWGSDGQVAFTKEQLLAIAAGFGEAEAGPVWKTWRKTSKCPGGQVEEVRIRCCSPAPSLAPTPSVASRLSHRSSHTGLATSTG